MNTRPDNETQGQPLSSDLAKAAESFGIDFVSFPVAEDALSGGTAAAVMKACDRPDRPLMVCGRTGGQSAKIRETAESA